MAAVHVDDLTLGSFLKIVSRGSVYNNLSEDSAIWTYITKNKKKGNAAGRLQKFLLRSAYGASACAFVKPNNGDYPSSHQSTLNEGTAEYKDFALTVEVERTLIQKAFEDFDNYGKPLAEELQAKSTAMSRMLSASVYGDGTGVLAQALDAGSVSGGKTVFNIDTTTSARGFVGWLELGDKVIVKNSDATAANPTVSSGTFDYYTVDAKDRAAGTVTLAAVLTDGTAGSVTATGVIAGDFIYKNNQADNGTLSDLSGAISADYNTLSEFWPGLATLSENDARVANGITLSGALGGTRRDAAGDPITSTDFQQLASQLMIAAGGNRYKYKQAMMAYETLDSLIESRETDRRFQSIEDNMRGVKSLGYQAGKHAIMFEADEYCPKQRVYLIPDGDVLQYWGSDFEFVEPVKGQNTILKPSSNGGFSRNMVSYMEGTGVLISTHSAAIGTIENFVVTS